MDESLRIVVMGTGPFAVPTFERLLGSGHAVLGLVTRPDRPVHRRGKSPVNPMREVAARHGLEVYEPESINSAEAAAWLTAKSADLFVVCDYGQILSKSTLGLARLGGINLHASLLPKYRGAAPINWAIYHGETETGVSVIHMTPQLDAGPCLVQLRTAIGSTETTPELEQRLSEIGVDAVFEAIDRLAGNDRGVAPQDSQQATKAPRLKKSDGEVDWTRSAKQIADQVRALQPWPKTYTFWRREGDEPVRLLLEQVAAIDNASETGSEVVPGTVLDAGQALVVACGQGQLRIDALQPAGKRTMAAAEFLRGHALQVGERLG